MFRQASLDLVRRSYPTFEGPLFVHALQDHLVGEVVWPVLEAHLRPTDVVVDLGCGSGSMVKRMGERVATAIGVDVDDSSFGKHAELVVLEPGDDMIDPAPGRFLVRADLAELPIVSSTVDLVTSRWVFEHLRDPGAAVAEVGRVLRPGGLALIIVPNRLHPGILLSSLFPVALKQWFLARTSGVEENLVLPTYYRANTGRALDRWFAAEGFDKIRISYVRDPSYWLFSAPLFRAATALGAVADRFPLERFRMHLVALYRKRGGGPGQE